MPSVREIKAKLDSISPIKDEGYYADDAMDNAVYEMEQALKSMCRDFEVVDEEEMQLADVSEAGGIWVSSVIVRCDDKVFRIKVLTETHWRYETTFPEIEEIEE
jgi:hypothetical protein